MRLPVLLLVFCVVAALSLTPLALAGGRPYPVHAGIDALHPSHFTYSDDGMSLRHMVHHVDANGRHTHLEINGNLSRPHVLLNVIESIANVQCVDASGDLLLEMEPDTTLPSNITAGVVVSGTKHWGCEDAHPISGDMVTTGFLRVVENVVFEGENVWRLAARKADMVEVFEDLEAHFYTNDLPEADASASTASSERTSRSSHDRKLLWWLTDIFRDVVDAVKDVIDGIEDVVKFADIAYKFFTGQSVDKNLSKSVVSSSWNYDPSAQAAIQSDIYIADGLWCSDCFWHLDVTAFFSISLANRELNYIAVSVEGEALTQVSFVATDTLDLATVSVLLATVKLGSIPFDIGIPLELVFTLPVSAVGSIGLVPSESFAAELGLNWPKQQMAVGISYGQWPDQYPWTLQSPADDGGEARFRNLYYHKTSLPIPIRGVSGSTGVELGVGLDLGLNADLSPLALSAAVSVVPGVGAYAEIGGSSSYPYVNLGMFFQVNLQAAFEPTLSFLSSLRGRTPVYTIFNDRREIGCFVQVEGNGPWLGSFPCESIFAGDGSSDSASLEDAEYLLQGGVAVSHSMESPSIRTRPFGARHLLQSGGAASTAPLVNISIDECPSRCSGRGTCNNGVCMCFDGFFGTDCSSRLPSGSEAPCFAGECTIVSNLTVCSHLNGLRVCVDSDRLTSIDKAVGDDLNKFKALGPSCFRAMRDLQCELRFPVCDAEADHFAKACYADCVNAYLTCGDDSVRADSRCSAASSSGVSVIARKSAADNCRRLESSPLASQCVTLDQSHACAKASGGKAVHLAPVMFDSADEASGLVLAFVNQSTAYQNATSPECVEAITAMQCSRMLPQCNQSLSVATASLVNGSTALRMCPSSCLAAMSRCGLSDMDAIRYCQDTRNTEHAAAIAPPWMTTPDVQCGYSDPFEAAAGEGPGSPSSSGSGLSADDIGGVVVGSLLIGALLGFAAPYGASKLHKLYLRRTARGQVISSSSGALSSAVTSPVPDDASHVSLTAPEPKTAV